MKKLTKIVSFILIFNLCFLSPVSITKAAEVNTSSITNNVIEKNSEEKIIDDSIIINKTYQSTSTGETAEYEIIDNENSRIVKQFINDTLVAQATYNKLSGEVTTELNGQSITQDANSIIECNEGSNINKNSTIALSENSLVATSSSWTLIASKYSSAWEQYGYLYQNSEVEDTTYYQLNLSVGTAIVTVLSIIDIFVTKGALSSVFKILGLSTLGVTVDTLVYGRMDAIRYIDNLKVYSNGECGLVTYRDRVVVEYDDNSAESYDGGDERTNDEMLDFGIYMVVLNNL